MILKTIQSVGHDLAGSPLALVLVLISFMFMAVNVYTVREISSAAARRDDIIIKLVQHCMVHEETK